MPSPMPERPRSRQGGRARAVPPGLGARRAPSSPASSGSRRRRRRTVNQFLRRRAAPRSPAAHRLGACYVGAGPRAPTSGAPSRGSARCPDLRDPAEGLGGVGSPPTALAVGSAELIEEVSTGKITGEEDRYSGHRPVGLRRQRRGCPTRSFELLAPAIKGGGRRRGHVRRRPIRRARGAARGLSGRPGVPAVLLRSPTATRPRCRPRWRSCRSTWRRWRRCRGL